MRTLPLAVAVGASLVAPASAQAPPPSGWAVELSSGSAFNVPTPLTFQQAGQPDIELSARYDTRPWTEAPYYAVRVGRWLGNRGWELELIHHKLYLRNPPREVQHFAVSHGYNLVLVNRAARRRATVWRAGAGVVIAHPEATVRQQALSEKRGLFSRGYHLSGAAIQAAAARRLGVSRWLHVTAELKVTAAYARVPIPDGHASVPNVAVHALLGVGYSF